MTDFRIDTPTAISLIGPSQAGKTHNAFRIIRDGEKLFKDPRCLKRVFYFYKKENESYKDNKHLIKQAFKELPSKEFIEQITLPYVNDGGSIIILDDFQEDINQDIVELFTQDSHHSKITVIILMQNLYLSGRVGEAQRKIKRNCHHQILFDNNMDQSQFMKLGHQMFPKSKNLLISALKAASTKYASTTTNKRGFKTKRGYLWIDGTPGRNPLYSLRTNIFSDENKHMRFFHPRNFA